MNSICNFGKDKEEHISLRKLAENSREKIFDFDYPLSEKVDKKEFEINILNKFMKRRIGTESFTDFKIELEVKLNEIMPKYNKMFDSFIDWDLFNLGEETIHTLESIENGSENMTSNAKSELNNTSNNTTNNTTENTNRNSYSDVPQNQIQDVENESYLTDYRKIVENNKNNVTSNDSSNSIGTNENTSNTNRQNNNNLTEKTIRTPSDKLNLYLQMQDNIKNIYTLIYNDLSSLFYGLVN